jgi:hypothetical protein
MAGIFGGGGHSSEILMPTLIKHWEKIYRDLDLPKEVQHPPPYWTSPSVFGIFRIRRIS